MRSLSLADTLPSKTRRSVPRLSPDQSVRTSASSAPRAGEHGGPQLGAAAADVPERARGYFAPLRSAEPWPFIGASGFLRFITHYRVRDVS